MTTRVDTIKIDYEGDGIVDDLTTITYEFTGDKIATKTSLTEDLNGGASRTEIVNYTYDDAGNTVGEMHYASTWWDGPPEFSLAIERDFDSAGRVQTEVFKSPDFNGNGVLDDYATITNYAYDAAGRLVFQRSDNTAWGDQAPSDYREETWQYDNDGNLLEHRLDDPVLYDCEIIRTYNYKYGNLQTIKEYNPIRFAGSDSERARTDESFHYYDEEGRATLHTSWADNSDLGWMQRVDTTFFWMDGYDNQTAMYDVQGDGIAEHKKFTENWYNADGQMTHTLVSYDFGADGGPLINGYDKRDLFVKTWDGETLVHETHDFNADGTFEYEFTSGLLVA